MTIRQFSLRLNPEIAALLIALAVFCTEAEAVRIIAAVAGTRHRAEFVLHMSKTADEVDKAAIILQLAAINGKARVLIGAIAAGERTLSVRIRQGAAYGPGW